jgi:hemoglobin-like flavoprotein
VNEMPISVDVPRPDAESSRAVQAAVRRLASRIPELGEAFYRHLFGMLPEVKPLFPDDMLDQRQRLVEALLSSVYALHDPEGMEITLQRLGATHHRRQVKEDQYQYIPHALLRAVRDITAGEFSTWESSAWISVYSWMVAHMVAGARRARLLEEQGLSLPTGSLAVQTGALPLHTGNMPVHTGEFPAPTPLSF